MLLDAERRKNMELREKYKQEVDELLRKDAYGERAFKELEIRYKNIFEENERLRMDLKVSEEGYIHDNEE